MKIAPKKAAIIFVGGAVVVAGIAVSHVAPYAGWEQNPFGILLKCAGLLISWLGVRVSPAGRHMSKALGGLVLLLIGNNLLKLTPNDGWWLCINLLAVPVGIGLCVWLFREFARIRSEELSKRV